MKRCEQRKEDTWDLQSVYEDDASWQEDYDRTLAATVRLETYKGRLSSCDDVLYTALCDLRDVAMMIEKIGTYASLSYECDSMDGRAQRMAGLASSLETRFSEAVSYMDPEIIAMDPATLDTWSREERFLEFRNHLERLVRMRKYTLSAAEERILALDGEAAEACSSAFQDLNDIDMDFGQVGGTKLTHATYSVFMQDPDDEVRREAYLKLYGEYDAHRHVLSRLYAGSVNQDIFLSRSRGYSSSLEAALYPDAVPEAVYRNLISSIHDAFPVLHRYYDLRAHLTGRRRLRHWDMYLPMVPSIRSHHTYDEAVELISQAVAPLGEEYRSTLVDGLTSSRWVDRYENDGKRSGAFSAGSYLSKPFILTSFKEDLLDSVFTLIHEGGHSMHTWYSARNNGFMDYGYTIFEAEVASTFNEELLSRHLVSCVDDRRMKAHLIASRLDDVVATLFRQTMFAEYELKVHEEVEGGGVATLDFMRTTYRSLLEAYFGPGVDFEDVSDLECLRIPHFYRAYYVYKYATGICAAIALADRVLCGGDEERDDYLAFLSSGGSRYPIDSLRLAGVDMSRKESVDGAVAHFSSLMDQLEALV